MAKKLTRAKAEKGLELVAEWLGPRMGYDGPAPTGADAAYMGEGPQLIMDWDWPSSGPTPTVLLEGGPYDWAIECPGDIQDKFSKVGIFAEPYAGYALCLYPEDW